MSADSSRPFGSDAARTSIAIERDGSVLADDRAQTFTIEAIAAALLLVGTVAFVVGTAGVTPLTGSTASQQVADQQRDLAVGVLDLAAEQEALRPTLLYWNASNETFHDVGEDGHYVDRGPPTAFGALLNRTLGDQGVAFNVHVVYVNQTGEPTKLTLVRGGTPTGDAAQASRQRTLWDGDYLRDANGTRTNETVANATSFYAPDASPDTPVYNVVRVEVVVWKV